MKKAIKSIIKRLLSHEISKSEAVEELFIVTHLSGMEINAKDALNSNVTAVYLADSSDYRGFHFEAIRHLTGIEGEISRENIKSLFDKLNPEDEK